MKKVNAIRVLNDPPMDGPTNMARDEAVMLQVGQNLSPPTLRLYQWISPTISLGYFQRCADYEALEAPAGDLPVVRRLTGGGAILHDLELTYSLSLPVDHPFLQNGPKRLYEVAHEAITKVLASLDIQVQPCGVSDDSGAAKGPFFCFARRHAYDLLLGDAKMVGSAQRCKPTVVLQHGSIILGNRFKQQTTARIDQEVDTIVAKIRQQLPAQFSEVTGVPFEPGEITPDELELAQTLLDKYTGSEWTKRT